MSNFRRIKSPALALIFIVIFASIYCVSCRQPHGNNCLDIHIWSNKPAYLPHEPIVINYQITNRSDHDIKTIFSSYDEYFEVYDQDGIGYANTLVRDFWYLPDTLKPGQSYQGGVEITDQYNIFSTGQFTCYLKIHQSLFAPACDTFLFSDTITFEIILPSGTQKEALVRYLCADSLRTARGEENRKMAVASYLALAEKYPNSVYAASALYWVVVMDDAVDNDTVYINACKKLIESYPESAFWGRVFLSLFRKYRRIHDKPAALEYFAYLARQYPNSKISDAAAYWLERVQKENF